MSDTIKKGLQTDRDEHLPEYGLKGVMPFGVDGGGVARTVLVDTGGRIITVDGGGVAATTGVNTKVSIGSSTTVVLTASATRL